MPAPDLARFDFTATRRLLSRLINGTDDRSFNISGPDGTLTCVQGLADGVPLNVFLFRDRHSEDYVVAAVRGGKTDALTIGQHRYRSASTDRGEPEYFSKLNVGVAPQHLTSIARIHMNSETRLTHEQTLEVLRHGNTQAKIVGKVGTVIPDVEELRLFGTTYRSTRRRERENTEVRLYSIVGSSKPTHDELTRGIRYAAQSERRGNIADFIRQLKVAPDLAPKELGAIIKELLRQGEPMLALKCACWLCSIERAAESAYLRTCCLTESGRIREAMASAVELHEYSPLSAYHAGFEIIREVESSLPDDDKARTILQTVFGDRHLSASEGRVMLGTIMLDAITERLEDECDISTEFLAFVNEHFPELAETHGVTALALHSRVGPCSIRKPAIEEAIARALQLNPREPLAILAKIREAKRLRSKSTTECVALADALLRVESDPAASYFITYQLMEDLPEGRKVALLERLFGTLNDCCASRHLLSELVDEVDTEMLGERELREYTALAGEIREARNASNGFHVGPASD